MASFLLHDSELTVDQRRVVELATSRNHLVLGPPGSGKTQVLLHRAKYLRDRLQTPPERFRIFVYTNVLTYFIRASLDYLGLEEQAVMTFDSWCIDFHERYISRSLPKIETTRRGKTFKTADYASTRKAVLAKLQQRPDLRGSLAFALVDEGQDLDATAYEILKLSANHVTVFGDSRQQIFETGASEEELLRHLGLNHQSAALLSAYRNSPDVANLAAYFISEQSKRESYLSEIRNFRSSRELPSFYVASTWDDELDQLADVLRQRQNLNQKACIVVPTNRDLGSVANGLLARGVAIERAVPPTRKSQTSLDFDNTIPKIATYHSVKGLTFDCVLMPKLVAPNFGRVLGERRLKLLLVGITRATQWVYLSTVAGYEIDEISRFRQAEAANHLFIRQGTSSSATVGTTAVHTEDDEEEGGFL